MADERNGSFAVRHCQPGSTVAQTRRRWNSGRVKARATQSRSGPPTGVRWSAGYGRHEPAPGAGDPIGCDSTDENVSLTGGESSGGRVHLARPRCCRRITRMHQGAWMRPAMQSSFTSLSTGSRDRPSPSSSSWATRAFRSPPCGDARLRPRRRFAPMREYAGARAG